MGFKKKFLIFLGSLLLSFLLYGNTIPGEFVYDDDFIEHLKEKDQLIELWMDSYPPNEVALGSFHPLTAFTFYLNYLLFGSSPTSFHIINIILNGVVTFLVYLLSKKLFKNSFLALFIGLFYAFLPIHSEAVANIKSRHDILATLFGIVSYLLFISATEDSKRINYTKVFLSSVIFILAVLSKELIIMLPALFIVTLYFRRKVNWSILGKITAIFVVVTALYMVWRFQVLGEYAFGKDKTYFIINPLAQVDFATRILTAFKIAFIYISKTFIPWNLSATYHYNQLTLVSELFKSWPALLGLIFLMILMLLSLHKRFRNSPIGIGALIFLISYSAISKFFFKGGDILAERWMYFPSIGLSFIAGFLLYLLFTKIRWLGILVCSIIFLIYSWILIPRNSVWLSEEKLFKSMTEDAPLSIQGHYALADWYFNNNNLDEAKKEVKISLSIYQDYPPLLNLLGNIALKEQNYKLAEEMFLKAITLTPYITEGYQNAANLYSKTGQYEKAEKMLEYLVTHWTKPNIEDYMDYALVLAKLGKYKTSMEVINRKLLSSNHPRVKFLLAINYFKMGNLEEARKYLDWDPTLREEEKIKILEEF